MHVHFGTDQLPIFKKPVITIGTFDGVHIGHQALIKHIVTRANEIHGESVLITFDPHPRLVLETNTKSIELLHTLDEKMEALQQLGVHHVVVVPFTTEFAHQDASDYIEHFLVRYFKPHTLIIGYDHHFGNKREGGFALLEKEKDKHGFLLEEIPAKTLENIAISSTKIRTNLKTGNMEQANALLGKPYSLCGKVIHGEKVGRQIGFPTANIEVNNSHKLVPANGVYAVDVTYHAAVYKGMMNIGTKPTLSHEKTTHLEVHLFNFTQEIYNEVVTILFKFRIRDEKKFDTIDLLIAQLQQDKLVAME